jgi:hypothetical protein
LDLLSHGDSCNRRSNDARSGLAADSRERALTNVSNAGEPGKFNATVEYKFGGTDKDLLRMHVLALGAHKGCLLYPVAPASPSPLL